GTDPITARNSASSRKLVTYAVVPDKTNAITPNTTPAHSLTIFQSLRAAVPGFRSSVILTGPSDNCGQWPHVASIVEQGPFLNIDHRHGRAEMELRCRVRCKRLFPQINRVNGSACPGARSRSSPASLYTVR